MKAPPRREDALREQGIGETVQQMGLQVQPIKSPPQLQAARLKRNSARQLALAERVLAGMLALEKRLNRGAP